MFRTLTDLRWNFSFWSTLHTRSRFRCTSIRLWSTLRVFLSSVLWYAYSVRSFSASYICWYPPLSGLLLPSRYDSHLRYFFFFFLGIVFYCFDFVCALPVSNLTGTVRRRYSSLDTLEFVLSLVTLCIFTSHCHLLLVHLLK